MSVITGRIYKIYNTVDDRCYIGSTTKSIKRRLAEHRCLARRIKTPFYKEMDKIGWGNTRVQLLEEYECKSKENLRKKEQHYIDEIRPELNTRNSYVVVKCEHDKFSIACSVCNAGLYRCGVCVKEFCSISALKTHLKSPKHFNTYHNNIVSRYNMWSLGNY